MYGRYWILQKMDQPVTVDTVAAEPNRTACPFISETLRTVTSRENVRLTAHSADTSPPEKGITIGHVHNILALQFFNGISRNTQSKSYMLS